MHRTSVRRAVTATAIGLTATVALTACQASDSTDANGKGGSSSAAASSSNSPSGSSANSSSESKPSSGNGSHASSTTSKASTCRTSNLRITAKNQGEARQGVGDILITFTNTGSNCRMEGFPGVDLKTNYGTQSVDRNKQEVGIPFTLKAGKRATANIAYPINNTGGSGVRGTALVVTPPNETHHVTVPVSVSLPVSNTDEGKLEVTPVFQEH